MDAIIEVLKIVIGLTVIAGIGYVVYNDGLPPRGRGRWRNVLSDRRNRRH
jgi:hypothetical protein